MKPFYTPKELIQILGFSKNTIYRYLEEGKIKSMRVGKGSFRVAATEVEKWLGGKKEELRIENGELKDPTERGRQEMARDVEVWVKEHVGVAHEPNVFDWFVGILAVGVGFAMFLWPAYFYQQEFAKVLPQFLWLRWGLVVGGLGFLVVDVIRVSQGARNWWHRVVHLLTGGIFGVVAYLAFVGRGDVAISLPYGAIALVVTVGTIVNRFSAVVKFAVLMWLMFALPVIVRLVSPGVYPQMVLERVGLAVVGWLVIPTVILFVSLWAIRRGKQWYAWLWGYNGLVCLGLATMAVMRGEWDFGVASILFGTFAFIMPRWKAAKQVRLGNARRGAVAMAIVGGVLVGGLVLVGVGRRAMEVQVGRNLSDRATSVAQRASDYLIASRQEVKALANSELLRQMLASGDLEGMEALLKSSVLASESFARLVVFDNEGTAVAAYPPTTPDLEGQDFGFGEQVERVLKGEVVISEAFSAVTAGTVWTVVIAAPVLGEEGEVMGGVTGAMDVGKLQEVFGAIKVQGGFVRLIDHKGRMVANTDPSLNFTQIPEWYVGRRALKGESGVELQADLGREDNEVFAYKAYQPVREMGWAVVMGEPVIEAMRLVTGVALLVFLAMFGVGVGWAVTFLGKDREK